MRREKIQFEHDSPRPTVVYFKATKEDVESRKHLVEYNGLKAGDWIFFEAKHGMIGCFPACMQGKKFLTNEEMRIFYSPNHWKESIPCESISPQEAFPSTEEASPL